MARLRMTAVMRSSAELNQILAQILEENGVERWEYSLDGYEDERQCLEREDGKWQVYFAERGQKRRCKTFEGHKEAAHELLRRLGRDETKRTAMAKAIDEKWWEFKVMPVVEEKRIHRAIAAVNPAAARPLVFYANDTKRAGKVARATLLSLRWGLKNAPKGMINKVTMKAFAEEPKKKEKGVKDLKQIETFGLK